MSELFTADSNFLFVGTILNNKTHSRMVANSFASSDGGKIIDLPGTYQLLKTLRL